MLCAKILIYLKKARRYIRLHQQYAYMYIIRNLIVVHGSKLFNSLVRQDAAIAKKAFRKQHKGTYKTLINEKTKTHF